MALTLLGIMIGLPAAIALTSLIKKLLFGVSSMDPLTFVSIPVLLAVAALLACYVPARRAAKVDPGVLLRGDSIDLRSVVSDKLQFFEYVLVIRVASSASQRQTEVCRTFIKRPFPSDAQDSYCRRSS
jgi:hypothetical protein